MKIPSLPKLSNLYDVFLTHAVEIDCLVYAIDACRYDPRLAEIVIKYLVTHWQKYNPLVLQTKLMHADFPASMGVILEHAQALVGTSENHLFRQFCKLVMAGIPKAKHELYFLGQRAIGGKKETFESMAALDLYQRWGYLWSHTIVPLPPMTRIPAKQRKHLLAMLLLQRKQISVNDYIEFLNQQIGRRQAELDLQKFPKLRSFGNTQAKKYYL